MLAISAVSFFPSPSFAQDIPDDDEGVVILINDQSLNGSGHGRSISPLPIKATFYASLSYVKVEFLSDLSEVTITVSNLDSGNTSTFIVDSQNSPYFIPLPFIPGLWQVSFHIEVGWSSYYGYFVL